MKQLARKWDMSAAQLSILLFILGSVISIIGGIIVIAWQGAERFTKLEYESQINLNQHAIMYQEVRTYSKIAQKAFENSKLLDIKKQDKKSIEPLSLPIGYKSPLDTNMNYITIK